MNTTVNLEPAPGRHCGSCTACCRLVPVADKELMKQAGVTCQHCRTNVGCRIYDRRPYSCRWWSCAWLTDPEISGAAKPNLTHVVIDCMGDTVIAGGQPMSVIQMWNDVDKPDAWRHPAIMKAIQMYADNRHCATLIRFNQERGCVVFAPSLTNDGQWHEVWTEYAKDRDEFNKQLSEIEEEEEAIK